jgi:hypothetical protein
MPGENPKSGFSSFLGIESKMRTKEESLDANT